MALDTSIKDIIRWELPSVDSQDSLKDVVVFMQQHRVSSLVVKSKDTVVGVISDTDIIHVLFDEIDLENIKACDLMTQCELIADEGTLNPCAQVDFEESVGTALKILQASGTHGLVVSGEDTSKTGIVCLRDLLAAAIS